MLPLASGPCQLNIRARPLVARRLAEHLQQQAADAFTLPLGDGAAYLPGVPAGQASHLALLPLQELADWAAARLLGQVLQPVAGLDDPLGLQSGTAQQVRLAVQSGSDGRSLNVFPEGASSGLGPFTAYAAPAATDLSLDGTPVPFADASLAVLGFTLSDTAEVRLYSTGGADTTGLLLDDLGNPMSSAHSGAADGAGFRIVARLAAGTYTVQVRAATPASFSVVADQPGGRGLADGRLDACLRSAGAAGADPTDLRMADCRGEGIGSLAGIGAYSGLQALRLDENPVTDLTPLGDLPQLAELSLAGVQPVSLAPLAELTRLYRLSLAGVALDANAVAVLEGLGARLTWLDLDGATGLSDADLSALKAALPNTTLVAPDGTVGE